MHVTSLVSYLSLAVGAHESKQMQPSIEEASSRSQQRAVSARCASANAKMTGHVERIKRMSLVAPHETGFG